MKNTLDDLIKFSCSIHAKLLEIGVPAEQALRIAFGKDFANSAIETIKNPKPKLKERGQIN